MAVVFYEKINRFLAQSSVKLSVFQWVQCEEIARACEERREYVTMAGSGYPGSFFMSALITAVLRVMDGPVVVIYPPDVGARQSRAREEDVAMIVHVLETD